MAMRRVMRSIGFSMVGEGRPIDGGISVNGGGIRNDRDAGACVQKVYMGSSCFICELAEGPGERAGAVRRSRSGGPLRPRTIDVRRAVEFERPAGRARFR